MIAKLAYVTFPAPNRYVLNIQPFGSDELMHIEIAKAHLVNILIDGTAVALREDQYQNRVPAAKQIENAANERASSRS